MLAVAEHPLPDGLADDWAVEWGHDKYGVFQSFAVGGVVQRLRWIGPAKFWMGSPPGEAGRWGDEQRREVVLSRGYWLADTPCTQALWRAVMGNNPSQFQGDDRRPVERVSWEDCQGFLRRLNELLPGDVAEGASRWVWRLPTEAEWERACRADTETATWMGDLDLDADDRKSTVLDRIAWYDRNSRGSSHAVAQKPPNPFGLFDMLGNVYEWCADWSALYGSQLVVDPQGPKEGDYRVIRGGSWRSFARLCRAASRRAGDPRGASDDLGFRLVRGRAPSPGAEPRGGAEGGRRAEPPAGGAGAGRDGAPRLGRRE